MNRFKKIAAIILVLVAVAMIVIGIKGNILPPPLTGIGFLVIAFVFLSEKKHA